MRTLELRQAKEGPLPGGSAELRPRPATRGRCPAWARTLRQGPQSRWTGDAGPFSGGLGREGWPARGRCCINVMGPRVSSPSQVGKPSLGGVHSPASGRSGGSVLSSQTPEPAVAVPSRPPEGPRMGLPATSHCRAKRLPRPPPPHPAVPQPPLPVPGDPGPETV